MTWSPPGWSTALHRARVKAAGHEAVCVSHQLPVETLRRAMTGRTLAHLPLPHSRLCERPRSPRSPSRTTA
jgi:hypothetical protein